MTGKLGHLAALLMESHPAAAFLHVEVLNLYAGSRTDSGEGVAHQSDQGAIAEPEQGTGVDPGQQLMHFPGREDGGLALADAVLRSPYRMGRVGLQYVPGHQPIEKHTEGGEVLLDGMLRVRAPELLDVGRDVHGRHPGQISEPFLLTPGGEALDGFEIGTAGIRVADVDGEELPEATTALGHSLEERRQTISREAVKLHFALEP